MVRKPGKHQILFEINRVTTVAIIIIGTCNLHLHLQPATCNLQPATYNLQITPSVQLTSYA